MVKALAFKARRCRLVDTSYCHDMGNSYCSEEKCDKEVEIVSVRQKQIEKTERTKFFINDSGIKNYLSPSELISANLRQKCGRRTEACMMA